MKKHKKTNYTLNHQSRRERSSANSFLRKPYWKSKVIGPGINKPNIHPHTHKSIIWYKCNEWYQTKQKTDTFSEVCWLRVPDTEIILLLFSFSLPFTLPKNSTGSNNFGLPNSRTAGEKNWRERVKKITQLQKIIELIKITIKNNSKIHEHTQADTHSKAHICITRSIKNNGLAEVMWNCQKKKCWQLKNTLYLYIRTSTNEIVKIFKLQANFFLLDLYSFLLAPTLLSKKIFALVRQYHYFGSRKTKKAKKKFREELMSFAKKFEGRTNVRAPIKYEKTKGLCTRYTHS